MHICAEKLQHDRPLFVEEDEEEDTENVADTVR